MASEQTPFQPRTPIIYDSPFLKFFLAFFGLIFIIGIIAPSLENKNRSSIQILRSIRNVRTITSALDLFASDFDGAYPNDQNLAHRKPSSASTEHSLTSEFYFNALLDRKLVSENSFYERSFKKAFQMKRPNGDNQLQPGENTWGYVKGLNQLSPGHLPLVFDSPISVGNSPKFSKKVRDGGKIIVARSDKSAVAETIGGSDKVSGNVRGKIDGERVNLFTPESLGEGILVPAGLKRIGSGN